jgi:hypothetical protein
LQAFVFGSKPYIIHQFASKKGVIRRVILKILLLTSINVSIGCLVLILLDSFY